MQDSSQDSLDHLPMMTLVSFHAVVRILKKKTLQNETLSKEKRGTYRFSDEAKRSLISQIMMIQKRSVVGPIHLRFYPPFFRQLCEVSQDCAKNYPDQTKFLRSLVLMH